MVGWIIKISGCLGPVSVLLDITLTECDSIKRVLHQRLGYGQSLAIV